MAVSLHIKTLTIAKPGAVTLNVTVAVSEARRLTFVLSGDPNESIRESLSLFRAASEERAYNQDSFDEDVLRKCRCERTSKNIPRPMKESVAGSGTVADASSVTKSNMACALAPLFRPVAEI